jgi:hypothetical protein
MNKTDIITLIEKYERILENSIEDSIDVVEIEPSEDDPKRNVDDFIKDDEVKRMFMSNLASIRSYAHSIIDMIDDGKPIQAWMADKIAVAAGDIKDVADGIDFRY